MRYLESKKEIQLTKQGHFKFILHVFVNFLTHHVIATSKDDVIHMHFNNKYGVPIHFYVEIDIYISLSESLLL
jgi:hypothetical protein